MSVKAITVFCGSKTGNHPDFIAHTRVLGQLLAQKGITLVYGGGNRGLMGVLANAAMEAGGKVVGVIPKILLEWEAQHDGITELKVVENMHVRKKMLYELGDAAIVLPGGNGTLDELYEMLTWNNLNIHNKKIALLNTAGFYNHLVAHMDAMLEQGFLYNDWRERLLVCDDPAAAISALV
jgi:uncharacterized protein (TIGR00730 family)